MPPHMNMVVTFAPGVRDVLGRLSDALTEYVDLIPEWHATERDELLAQIGQAIRDAVQLHSKTAKDGK